MIKVPISQQGQAVTYIASNGALYHDGETHILVYVHQRVEQPGLPAIVQEMKPMRVDDTTPIPCVNPDGTALMHTVSRLTGQYVVVEVESVLDDEGQVVQAAYSYTDYSQPLYQEVAQQRTIGEYQAVKWWHWDKRNPEPQPAIEEMIEEGIRRKVGLSAQPYVFVVTPEFVAAFGNDW